MHPWGGRYGISPNFFPSKMSRKYLGTFPETFRIFFKKKWFFEKIWFLGKPIAPSPLRAHIRKVLFWRRFYRTFYNFQHNFLFISRHYAIRWAGKSAYVEVFDPVLTSIMLFDPLKWSRRYKIIYRYRFTYSTSTESIGFPKW